MAIHPAEEATGKLSEALEYIERARGHLFDFHQLTGHADLLLDEVLEALDKTEKPELGDLIKRELYGRNVLEGRWTFQIVDEFEDGFYSAWRSVEAKVREELTDGERHLYEARMKKERQAKGVNASAG
jgi:hypothetical protein